MITVSGYINTKLKKILDTTGVGQYAAESQYNCYI